MTLIYKVHYTTSHQALPAIPSIVRVVLSIYVPDFVYCSLIRADMGRRELSQRTERSSAEAHISALCLAASTQGSRINDTNEVFEHSCLRVTSVVYFSKRQSR